MTDQHFKRDSDEFTTQSTDDRISSDFSTAPVNDGVTREHHAGTTSNEFTRNTGSMEETRNQETFPDGENPAVRKKSIGNKIADFMGLDE
jgi:hypothetical protein